MYNITKIISEIWIRIFKIKFEDSSNKLVLPVHGDFGEFSGLSNNADGVEDDMSICAADKF